MTATDKTLDGTANERAILERAGFSPGDATAWCAAHPELRDDFGSDSAASTRFWDLSQGLRAKLPAKTARDPVFGFEVVTECPGVPASLLVPRDNWRDRTAYDAAAVALADRFKRNFRTFESEVSPDVRAAGPA